jgi:hypothetical protein
MFFDFHLDKYFNTSNNKCKFTRGILEFGGPLEGYLHTEDDDDEQRDSKFVTRWKLHGTPLLWVVDEMRCLCEREQRSRNSSLITWWKASRQPPATATAIISESTISWKVSVCDFVHDFACIGTEAGCCCLRPAAGLRHISGR